MPRYTMTIPVSMPQWVYQSARTVWHAVRRASSREPGAINLLGDRDMEWSWILAHLPSGPGEALDVGSGESPLALVAAQRGFHVTAVDLEPVRWPYIHPALQAMQGDLLTLALAAARFDVVINCSTIEHIGLTGRYGVTEDRPNGDLEVMDRLRHAMKPGGMMLLTTPVGRDALFAPLCRVYGAQRLPRLLEGYQLDEQTYWAKDEHNRWINTERDIALRVEASVSSQNPLQNRYALGCFLLRNVR